MLMRAFAYVNWDGATAAEELQGQINVTKRFDTNTREKFKTTKYKHLIEIKMQMLMDGRGRAEGSARRCRCRARLACGANVKSTNWTCGESNTPGESKRLQCELTMQYALGLRGQVCGAHVTHPPPIVRRRLPVD